MKAFVLDASLTMEWFNSGASADAVAKRSLFEDRIAVVPHLWRFEVMNVLAAWRRCGDISSAQGTRIFNSALALPFAVINECSAEAVVELANAHGLSAYDATYLRVAIVTGEPLATLDRKLKSAASKEGIECL